MVTGSSSLKTLVLRDFTGFSSEEIEFGDQLTVVVGENGSGKSNVLRAAYAGIASLASLDPGRPVKSQVQNILANKFSGVFRPDSLGRLVRRAHGRLKCGLDYQFADPSLHFGCSFSRLAKAEVVVHKVPTQGIAKRPVYLPTRELLSIYPGFVSVYETTHLSFEETWRDTCILLGAPLARGAREAKIREVLAPLEEAMEGKIELDKAGRFYLKTRASGRMEMHLVAEGLRKLAMVARLIATGSLLETGYLFWDEPEANLNPRLVKLLALTILQIASNGVQVFIATHSLFLLRELDLLSAELGVAALDARYIGLSRTGDGAIVVTQGRTMDEVGDIASLDEELLQSDRYLAKT